MSHGLSNDTTHMANHLFRSLAWLLAAGALAACSKENPVHEAASTQVSVQVGLNPGTRAMGDATSSVDRILILPFRKTSEAAPETASSYVPSYATAKELNINTFPARMLITNLNMTVGVTHRIVVVGYNSGDYTFNASSPENVAGRFSIGSASAPTTLANFHLRTVSPASVPEFFACVCEGFDGIPASIGKSFLPEEVHSVQGTLTRLASGVSVTVSDIPAFVTSVSLAAEQLVAATRPVIFASGDTEALPTVWQTPGDGGPRTLATAVPAGGTVVLEAFLLPTLDTRNTLLYLDIGLGSTSQRYTIQIPDLAGVSASNRITFAPNAVVRITGSYDNIDVGFTLANDIDLDDNAWDGLQ